MRIEPLTEASLPACLEIYNYYVVNTVFSLDEAALTRQEYAARAQGITTLISLITSENDNSCAFHERNGFVLEGDLHDVAVKFGRQVGVRYYRKRL